MATYPLVDSLVAKYISCTLIPWVDSLEWGVCGFLSLGDSLVDAVYILFSYLGWIPLSSEFMATYPVVDSLGGDICLLFFYPLDGFPCVSVDFLV